MHLISTKHTQSAFRMLYRFINLLKKWSVLVINFLFLGIYSFLIYVNVNKLSLLVTYSIILGISFLYFIVYLVNEFFVHNNEKNKIIGKIGSYLEKSRYIFRLLVIVFNFIDYFCINQSKKLLFVTILSLALFIFQIIFLLILFFIKKYIKIFEVAINKDIEDSFATTIINPKKAINRALSRYASNLEGEEIYSLEDQRILSNLESEIDEHEKSEREIIKNERDDALNRIKIVYKNKFEEKFVTNKSREIFLKNIKKLEMSDISNEEIRRILGNFTSGYNQINADEKVLNIIMKVKTSVEEFLEGKYPLKPEELIYLLGYLMSIGTNIKFIFKNIQSKKFAVALTNLLLENNSIKRILEKR